MCPQDYRLQESSEEFAETQMAAAHREERKIVSDEEQQLDVEDTSLNQNSYIQKKIVKVTGNSGGEEHYLMSRTHDLQMLNQLQF